MKARCYYCNKELTEKTIKKHIKSCVEMKRFINEKRLDDKRQRNQFIISIKPKYEKNEYCLYLSISGLLGLVNIDKFIRDVWVECCDHLSGFKIRNNYYQDNEMNIQLNDILNKNEKFEYEYDFQNTTHLILEVVDIRKVPNGFSEIEIVARNNEVIHKCEICGKETNNFNKEQIRWECIDCSDCNMNFEFKYCNSPRDGICNYVGYKEIENMYFPGNDNKYKSSENIIKKQEYSEKASSYEEYILTGISNMVYGFEASYNRSGKNPFSNGVYSFNLKELISNLSKEQIYDIARCLGMTKISTLNKGDLIDKFVCEYELLIERKMYSFDEERYKVLRKYSNNNGVKILKEVEKDLEKIGYFFKSGMLFAASKDGVAIVVMPQIIQELVKEKNNIQYRNMIKINSEIINLYRGMNNAYGILKLEDLKELFIRYNIEEAEKYNIEIILKNAEDYYREYEVKGMFFINNYVDNWEELLNEIEVDGEYSIISKEELLSMATENRIYTSEAGKILIREFLSMFDMEEYILEGLIESLYLEIQENDLEEVINEILEQLDGENKDIEEFMCKSVGKFLKSVRIWKYKGDTINDRNDSVILNEKQNYISRNDNCICGSGKKYKNCCAKNGNVISLF